MTMDIHKFLTVFNEKIQIQCIQVAWLLENQDNSYNQDMAHSILSNLNS